MTHLTNASHEYTVRNYFQILDSGDLSYLDDLFAPNYVLHYSGIEEPMPIDGAKQILSSIGSAFPGSRHTIRELSADKGRIVASVGFSGTHGGTFLGIAPTGKPVAITTTNTFRFEAARIAEQWIQVDLAEVLRQISPAPASNGAASMAYRNGHSSAEANKAIVRRVYDELINQERPAVIGEVFASDAVIHDPLSGTTQGAQAFAQLLNVFDTAFPHHRVTVEQAIAEGDYVSVLHTHYATHTGPFLGMPATGKSVVVNGVEVFRLLDGKVVEFWRKDDDVSLLMQLGALPMPEHG